MWEREMGETMEGREMLEGATLRVPFWLVPRRDHFEERCSSARVLGRAQGSRMEARCELWTSWGIRGEKGRNVRQLVRWRSSPFELPSSPLHSSLSSSSQAVWCILRNRHALNLLRRLSSLQPTSFLRLHTDDHSDPNCKIKINHGTTTLAFRFKGGIIVAVDSRATAGSYIGEFTSNFEGISSAGTRREGGEGGKEEGRARPRFLLLQIEILHRRRGLHFCRGVKHSVEKDSYLLAVHEGRETHRVEGDELPSLARWRPRPFPSFPLEPSSHHFRAE